jgi:hypothetical protein
MPSSRPERKVVKKMTEGTVRKWHFIRYLVFEKNIRDYKLGQSQVGGRG